LSGHHLGDRRTQKIADGVARYGARLSRTKDPVSMRITTRTTSTAITRQSDHGDGRR
jgi:hypothetical protein